MTKRHTVGTAVLLSLAIGATAFAQSAPPIANSDVIGEWRLAVTPVERQDLRITFKSRDGDQKLDFPLTITGQAGGPLACVIDGDPGQCRIRDGKLTVVMAGGGPRMTFTLTDRTRGGFSGSASIRVRMLPIGGQIGSVTMVRR